MLYLHTFETRKYYNRRCPSCYPNLFASRKRTPREYKLWLKENRPELKLLGPYVDSRTRTRYHHSVCNKVFDMSPSGVTRKAFRCPNCAPKTRASYTEFNLGKRLVKIRGKEYVALDWILTNTNIKPNEIEVDSDGTLPKLKYWDGNRLRAYEPDFYMRTRNIIVEVKDLCTIGLAGHFFYKSKQHLWRTACAKAKACIEAGYTFNMLVFDKTNTRVKLPKNWYSLTQKQVLKLLG